MAKPLATAKVAKKVDNRKQSGKPLKKKKKKFSERQKRLLLQNYHSSSEDEQETGEQKPLIAIRPLRKEQIITPKVNPAHLVKKRQTKNAKNIEATDSKAKRSLVKTNTNKNPVKEADEEEEKESEPQSKRKQKSKEVTETAKKPIKSVAQSQLKDKKRSLGMESDVDSNEDDDLDSDDDAAKATTDEVHSTIANPGWADVVAKILAKNPKLEANQSSVVLVKASRDYELVEQPGSKHKSQKQKQDWENLCRNKPHHNEREAERRLALIASRGVVQLFNTIRQQKLERRRNKWATFENGCSALNLERKKRFKVF